MRSSSACGYDDEEVIGVGHDVPRDVRCQARQIVRGKVTRRKDVDDVGCLICRWLVDIYDACCLLLLEISYEAVLQRMRSRHHRHRIVSARHRQQHAVFTVVHHSP